MQGNLDPSILGGDWELISEEVIDILKRNAGQHGHIFNLGHGVTPEVNPDVLKRVVDLVHNFSDSLVNITIVGAGIAGLSAAFELQQSGFEVMLLEGSERLGGKILTSEIEGFNIDAGPDSFLTRDPEMRELCFSLGVGDELVAPTGKPAKVWVDGEMHNLPKRHFLGVPLDLDELDELSLLTEEGLKEQSLI